MQLKFHFYFYLFIFLGRFDHCLLGSHPSLKLSLSLSSSASLSTNSHIPLHLFVYFFSLSLFLLKSLTLESFCICFIWLAEGFFLSSPIESHRFQIHHFPPFLNFYFIFAWTGNFLLLLLSFFCFGYLERKVERRKIFSAISYNFPALDFLGKIVCIFGDDPLVAFFLGLFVIFVM